MLTGRWQEGVAWCELRTDFRNFRLDRMRELAILDEEFLPDPGRFFPDPGRFLPDPGRFLPDPGRFLPDPGRTLEDFFAQYEPT